MSNKKFGLFFGAGAEIAYGLPSGGRFALEIFQRKERLGMTRGPMLY